MAEDPKQLDTSLATLPIIDISPYLTTDPAPSSIAATNSTLRAALLSPGFFYITNHGIPPETFQKVLKYAGTFFTKGSAGEKLLIQRRDPGVGMGDGARGYQPLGENVTGGKRDWHEAVDWYAPWREGEGFTADDLKLEISFPHSRGPRATNGTNGTNGTNATNGTEMPEEEPVPPAWPASKKHADGSRDPPYDLLQGQNLWPSTPPDFREVYEDYVVQMRALGTAVLKAMGAALELREPDLFAEAAKDSFWVMRAIGYPPLPPLEDDKDGGDDMHGDEGLGEDGVSCGEHSDYGCLTLLLADETPGALQVRVRSRNEEGLGEWKEVGIVPNALVVNVGDMIERWTAGWVRSTKHRVVHQAKGHRISVPFFLEPGKDVIIKPLEECAERIRAEGLEPVTGEVRYWDHLVEKVKGNFYKGN